MKIIKIRTEEEWAEAIGKAIIETRENQGGPLTLEHLTASVVVLNAVLCRVLFKVGAVGMVPEGGNNERHT